MIVAWGIIRDTQLLRFYPTALWETYARSRIRFLGNPMLSQIEGKYLQINDGDLPTAPPKESIICIHVTSVRYFGDMSTVQRVGSHTN